MDTRTSLEGQVGICQEQKGIPGRENSVSKGLARVCIHFLSTCPDPYFQAPGKRRPWTCFCGVPSGQSHRRSRCDKERLPGGGSGRRGSVLQGLGSQRLC